MIQKFLKLNYKLVYRDYFQCNILLLRSYYSVKVEDLRWQGILGMLSKFLSLWLMILNTYWTSVPQACLFYLCWYYRVYHYHNISYQSSTIITIQKNGSRISQPNNPWKSLQKLSRRFSTLPLIYHQSLLSYHSPHYPRNQ